MQWRSILPLLVAFSSLTFAEIERTFRVSESTAPGHLIGHLQSSDRNIGFYIVFPPKTDHEQALAVDDRTGEIRTSRALDFETSNSYTFLAIPLDGSATIRVVVDVVDENDNSPTFPVPNIDVHLSEYARINAQVPLPSAVDADSERLSVQKYLIKSGNVNNVFRLASRNIGRLLYVDLVVNSPLDREYRDHYRLIVEAVDGGNPPLIGRLSINISIIDANDNAPEFDQSRYLAKINRHSLIGSEIAAISARDADIGPNGEIEYRMLANPDSEEMTVFTIDRSTGSITLVESPMNLRKNAYELLVIARDFGQPLPLESTTLVNVIVENDADSTAMISVIFLNDNGQAAISESARIGDLVARISIDWPDGRAGISSSSSRSFLNMTMSGADSAFSLQTADSAVFLLIVADQLDREAKDSFHLTLVATDSNGQIAIEEIRLTILDENDNAPRFSRSIFEAEVREKSPQNRPVLQITATDEDYGENARISYSLKAEWPFNRWFHIDPDTGLITSLQSVDCEISSRPELTVVASDHGHPPLRVETKVRISVLDVNDNSPVFEKSLYNCTLPEDAEIGTCFLKVVATDADCGVNSNVRFSLGVRWDSRPMFSIDNISGTLCLNNLLDYESQKRYQLTVMAQDEGGLSSSSLVDILVEDRDDNPPIFHPSTYSISVRENAPIGLALLLISATDEDEGIFGNVKYRLSTTDDSAPFCIDENTGQLFILDRLSPGSTVLTVQASDGGNLNSVESARINVLVVRKDYPCPTFDSIFYRFSTAEDTMPGIVIGTVRAVGPATVRYGIFSGDPNGRFHMDQQSGELSIVRYLDADRHPSILLNVQASIGEPPSYNHTQVLITVDDRNDNAPVFEISLIKTTVREDQILHVPFFAVRATDRDRGDNARLTYHILAGHPTADPFLIRPTTGQLALRTSIDLETVPFYRLIIGADDGGIPRRSANVTLEVSLIDVNDNPPRILNTDRNSRVQVAEDVPTMTNLVHISAVDDDSGPNARLVYEIVDAEHFEVDAEHFGITADSGWVFVAKALDRERHDEHVIHVRVVDGGTPAWSAHITITVAVTDVNDNAPDCPSTSLFTVAENSPPNTPVGTIKAVDRDLAENGTVAFRLVDKDDGRFFRVENDGEIFSNESFDAENLLEYSFRVHVQDYGTPPLSTVCNVRIEIQDLNDNAPTFVLPLQQHLSIRQQQPIGTEIAQIRADDPDRGENGTVVYSLQKSDFFTIDCHSGVITTLSSLDFHTLSESHNLTVFASDLGGLNSSKTLQLLIPHMEIDLHPVSLINTENRSKLVLRMSEDAPIGSKLGPIDVERPLKIIATTLDDLEDFDPQLLAISYQIVAFGNSGRLFEIDQFTSIVYLTGRLDFESRSRHLLHISKTNSSRPQSPLVSYIDVIVLVLDENDNAPEFATDPVIVSVPENAVQGRIVVGKFDVSDKDEGANGRLSFDICKQIPDGVFQVDSVTGQMRLMEQLDREEVAECMVIVRATDQAVQTNQRRSTKVTVRIYVTDVNDNNPVFTSPDRIVIDADQIVQKDFFFVVAQDDDWAGNGRVSYRITGGNGRTRFRINGTSGALSMKTRLDDKTDRRFELDIQASDHGTSRHWQKQKLFVTVYKLKRDSPRFENAVFRMNVSENAPKNIVIGTISANDPKDRPLSFDLFVAESDRRRFSLDSNSGQLVLTGVLDREREWQFRFNVFVRDSTEHNRYDSAILIITVDDLNDNSPEIAKSSCYTPVFVPENVVFDYLHRFIATDIDSGFNGLVSYTIEGGNMDKKFALDPSTGILSSLPLDRELTSEYNLRIFAKDNGQSPRNDSCIFTVVVGDRNDVIPKFTHRLYVTTVMENAPIGTAVIKLTATDDDQGENGQVTYSLDDRSGGKFAIHPESGQLTVARSLDFERHNTYILTVKASDNGLKASLYSETNVTIRLLDVNDRRPEFAESFTRIIVPTNLTPGQQIVRLSAIDKDGPGDNSLVSYRLTNPSSEFRIDPSLGLVESRSTWSMSQGSNRYLLILATDGGFPRLFSTSAVELTFASESNVIRHPMALEFNEDHSRIRLSKSAASGFVVHHFQARRMDNEAAGGIFYNIVAGNQLGVFGIENWSGRLFLADSEKLKSESHGSFELLIEASSSLLDLSNVDGQRLAYSGISVEIVDKIDEEPEFLQHSYVGIVKEGKSRGEFVIQLSAWEASVSEDSRITYSIVKGNRDSAFRVDEEGRVSTRVQLDREIHDSYSLTILAVVHGEKPKSSTTIVNIRVIDTNDNRPSFPPIRMITIDEASPIGTLLTTVAANDVDANPILQYSFVSGLNDYGDQFEIDKFAGTIILADKLDYERTTSYLLQIQASDGVHSTFTELKVQILDENDNKPTFSELFYRVSLPEDTPIGASIMQMHAIDADDGENGRISYKIIGGNVGFRINATSGAISTVSSLNADDFVSLRIRAFDGGHPPLSSLAIVHIQVVDTSDRMPPKFDRNFYSMTIDENAPIHSLIGRLKVENNNTELIFGVDDGDPEGVFSVEEDGSILLNKQIDREKVDEYRLWISVQSKSNSVSNSTTSVLIRINDVNDNIPTFSQSNIDVFLDDNVKVGDTVKRLSVSDDDSNSNGLVFYEITSGHHADLLHMDTSSGTLTLARPILAAERRTSSLMVRAFDGGVPSRFSFLRLSLTLADPSLHPGPFFPVPFYLGGLSESAPIGSFILTVKAAHENADELRYFLEGDDRFFLMNELTGQLTSGVQFDYEIRSSYRLSIVVKDGRDRSAVVPGQVLINGVDEFAPKFSQKISTFRVSYNSEIKTVIGAVFATDRDSGLDGQISYSLENHQNGHFEMNDATGVLTVGKSLRKLARSRRISTIRLVVIAKSGHAHSGRESRASIIVKLGRFESISKDKSIQISPTVISIISTVLIILLIGVLVFVLVKLRPKIHKNQSSIREKCREATTGRSALSIVSKEWAKHDNNINNNNNNNNDMAKQTCNSQQKTRMNVPAPAIPRKKKDKADIATCSVRELNARPMPDSGIDLFDEGNSWNSSQVPSTREYLTSLGVTESVSRHDIDKVVLGCRTESGAVSQSENELNELIYSKVSEVLADEGQLQSVDCHRYSSSSSPLSTFDNLRYNHGTLGRKSIKLVQDQPSYQPLTRVFDELSRLRNEPMCNTVQHYHSSPVTDCTRDQNEMEFRI